MLFQFFVVAGNQWSLFHSQLRLLLCFLESYRWFLLPTLIKGGPPIDPQEDKIRISDFFYLSVSHHTRSIKHPHASIDCLVKFSKLGVSRTFPVIVDLSSEMLSKIDSVIHTLHLFRQLICRGDTKKSFVIT